MLRLDKFVTCYLPPAVAPAASQARTGGGGGELADTWMRAFPYDVVVARNEPVPRAAVLTAAEDTNFLDTVRRTLYEDLPSNWVCADVHWRVRAARDEWGEIHWREDNEDGEIVWHGTLTRPYALPMSAESWTRGALTSVVRRGTVVVLIFRFFVREAGEDQDQEGRATSFVHALVLARLDQNAAVLCTTVPVSAEQLRAMKTFAMFHCVTQLFGDAAGSRRRKRAREDGSEDESEADSDSDLDDQSPVAEAETEPAPRSWQFLTLDLSKLAMRQQMQLETPTTGGVQEAVSLCLYARVMQFVCVRAADDVARVCESFPSLEEDQWGAEGLQMLRAREVCDVMDAVLRATRERAERLARVGAPSGPTTAAKASRHTGESFIADLRDFVARHAAGRILTHLRAFGFSGTQKTHLLRVPNPNGGGGTAVSVSTTESPAWSRRPLIMVLFVRSEGARTTDVLDTLATTQLFANLPEEYETFSTRIFPDHVLWSGMPWLHTFLSEHYLEKAKSHCLFCPLLFLDADETVDFAQETIQGGGGGTDHNPGLLAAFLPRALRHAGWLIFRLRPSTRSSRSVPAPPPDGEPAATATVTWEMFVVAGPRGRIPPMFEAFLTEEIEAMMGAPPQLISANAEIADEKEENTFQTALQNLLRPFPRARG